MKVMMYSCTVYYSLFWPANNKIRKAPGKLDGPHFRKYLSDIWAEIPFTNESLT